MEIKKMKIYFKYAVIVLMVLAFGVRTQPDDKELFMGMSLGDAVVRPNVVILMDNSLAMNTVIFYPKNGLDKLPDTGDDGYDPKITYTGTVEYLNDPDNFMSETTWVARWQRDGNADVLDKTDLTYNGQYFWTGCYANDGTPNNFQCGSNGWNYFRVGDQVLFYDTRPGNSPARATITRKYTGSNGQPWFELEDIEGGPIIPHATDNNVCQFQQAPTGLDWKPVIVQLYGTLDHDQPAMYPDNYLRWLYIHAAEFHRDAVTHFSNWGTFDVNVEPPAELSNCATPGNDDLSSPNPRIKKLFTRIQTAREVICRVATVSNQIVKLGLFKFTYDDGGTLSEGLTDMSDEASLLVAYKNSVWGIFADTWAPLAEALADVWYYYKPGPANKTYYPVDYELANKLVTHSVSNPVTPIDYWCQKNYVVIMTEGESTKDNFVVSNSGKFANSPFTKMPVKRAEPWTDWEDGWGDYDNDDQSSGVPPNYDPNGTYCPKYTCWLPDKDGTDYLDDVAYFINHQDMFPDDHFGTDEVSGWPGDQNIFTYTIGFAGDNDMLRQTAINGDGAYYIADNYDELVDAFENVITSINLRNFAFSSITAPRKTTTATNDELTVSYVGYFLPSQAAPIWEGHLLAFKLQDQWGFDADLSGTAEAQEFVYDSENSCLNASGGQECLRWIGLSIGHVWDAAAEMPEARNLYSHINTTDLLNFDITNHLTFKPIFGPTVSEPEAEMIVSKISQPHLADIFHADVGFVGAPPFGKQFISNLNPTGTGDETYEDYYYANQNRSRVLYTGTNDGILHMFYGDGINAGREIWGFIPDEVLPSLKKIVLDNEHTYTVDGRLAANDIYYVKPNASANSWTTLLVFGLRRGGNAFYGMDITRVEDKPKLLWKFKDDIHSGQSWGKPIIARIMVQDPDNITSVISKWVVVLPGGFAFNSENPNNLQGKAVFIVDAATGELLWKIAYDPLNGAEDTDNADMEIVEVNNDIPNQHLTRSEKFNYPFPSALTAVDKDNDGYMDAIYYGNVGGHLFKTDFSNPDMKEWTTYLLYKTVPDVIPPEAAIESIVKGEFVTQITISAADKGLVIGDGIMGKTSYATGYIVDVDNKILFVKVTSGAFQVGEMITAAARKYDPIYLSPTVAYDTCYRMWVAFGTGDRDRPRTNLENGRFIILKDDGTTDLTKTDFSQISFGSDGTLTGDSVENGIGWHLEFTQGVGEKLFDPEPIILPDEDLIPHIYFNTYRPPETKTSPGDNPCDAPDEGIMTVYDLYLSACGTTDTIEGERFTGRIAGGGMYQGKEFVLYISKSGDVADVPGGEGGNFSAVVKKLPYPGGIVFWLEKRR
jgi:hypothetical protein